MSLIIAVLMLGIIIMIHEFGHFLFAKLNGIGVIEFSLGMGPRIWSCEKGGTRYSFKALPFGGSCMMLGEDENDSDEHAFNNNLRVGQLPQKVIGQPKLPAGTD